MNSTTVETGKRAASERERATPWLHHRPRFRPDIEGLRAIAVLLVVAFHAKVPGFSGGFIGVDVFFVLSGYLITWLLVDEAERTGTVRLRTFYARRARRLLPALAVVLLVTLTLTAVLYAPFEQRFLARTWAMTALYVSNVHFAGQALDYNGTSAESNPLLHTWSLSVEEQFYLVWPLLVLAGLGALAWQRKRRAPSPSRLLVTLCVTSVASFAYSLWLTHTNAPAAFYLSPSRAWEFGVGGIAVLLPLGSWPRRQLNSERPNVWTNVLGWVGLAGLVIAATLFSERTPFPGIAAFLPVLSTVAVLRAGTSLPERDNMLQRLLSTQPFQAIGKLSYSWYLWHWPALVFAASLSANITLVWRLVAVSASLGIAFLSYRFVENPVRHSRILAGRPARSFAMSAAISLGAVALTALWWYGARTWESSSAQQRISQVARTLPMVYDDPNCDNFAKSVDVKECVFGDIHADRSVLLVGDSHAAQFAPALAEAAAQNRWRLVVVTKSACPMVDLPAIYNEKLGRTFVECEQWREKVLDVVDQLAPNLTIAGSSSRYHWQPAGWEAGTRSVLTRLQHAGGRVVMIMDPPAAGLNIPECLARAAWRWGPIKPDCSPIGDPASAPLVDAQERAARSVPGVEILDVRERVCTIGECEAMAGNLIRYRDSNHLSVEFAETFSDTFASLLNRASAPPGASAAP